MLFKGLGFAVSLGALPYLANAKDVPEVCHKPLANALICHDNGVYDCIKEERLYVCGEGSCYFFQSGPKCAPPGFDAFEPGALDDLGNTTSSDTVNDYPGFEEARGARTRTTTSESTSSASCTADTSTVTVISWVSWNNSVSSSSSADSSSGSDAKFLSSRATSASTAPSTLTTLLTVKTMIGPSNSSASSSETTSSSSLSTAATKRSVLGDTSGPEDSVELKNGIGYDCINKKMLEKCDGGDYDCQTFMSGARCVPLWIGGEYAPIRPTSTTSATSGSVTSTAPAGSSTYSPQRLCNAANEPDDPTLKLYTDPDVETGTPQSKYDHDRWYLALSRGASFNPDAVPQLEDPGNSLLDDIKHIGSEVVGIVKDVADNITSSEL
ncbi:uncharacterized protein MYCFIDRAFT_78751 [Pseudocercospora fijiensis CIRAD86]|uniref:Uncharacterized protein n=1 Tax=Pseudocercospora fijiensis (strain CIRAD86) TaxID=383855 RepID=M3AWH2_PSEFD|nr:uncharacterized protein MYCFIDRAFT_78751 [Pseudocercospora fijiensis CIRAD86]EME81817.1 hypothetical protein MYCFIDRAFT_78751 [Pseudocercospora fijiensis CIRAD86]